MSTYNTKASCHNCFWRASSVCASRHCLFWSSFTCHIRSSRSSRSILTRPAAAQKKRNRILYESSCTFVHLMMQAAPYSTRMYIAWNRPGFRNDSYSNKRFWVLQANVNALVCVAIACAYVHPHPCSLILVRRLRPPFHLRSSIVLRGSWVHTRRCVLGKEAAEGHTTHTCTPQLTHTHTKET